MHPWQVQMLTAKWLINHNSRGGRGGCQIQHCPSQGPLLELPGSYRCNAPSVGVACTHGYSMTTAWVLQCNGMAAMAWPLLGGTSLDTPFHQPP